MGLALKGLYLRVERVGFKGVAFNGMNGFGFKGVAFNGLNGGLHLKGAWI
jgi:hypothetical protein